MKSSLTAGLLGLLFGLGLLLAGMANPAKVSGFLDIAGLWDPSLALVMVGGICAATGLLAWAGHRQRSLLGLPMQLPKPGKPDARLLLGAALFGLGWGLAGICPGPALLGLTTGETAFVPFVLAMLAGMGLYNLLPPPRS
ncbi:MAG: YeeE/YedE family protein [Chitinimonas sp.]|nr:YeeE/YedE family protein [Chitinimonas sp.]